MARLFVSYARPERALVEALVADLRRAGYDAFFDEQLTGGQGWWEQLLTNIEGCDAFVPALTRTYVNSVPCRREADYAYGLSKPFLAVMLESMNPAECADYIADSHCVTYVQGDSATAIDLMRALMSLPPCPALPEPMPERPEIPVTYIAAAIRSATDRVESADDLTRVEQVLLLSDLKTLLAGQHSATARDLLLEFNARTDLTVQVANDIQAVLATHALGSRGETETVTEIRAPQLEPEPPAGGSGVVPTAADVRTTDASTTPARPPAEAPAEPPGAPTHASEPKSQGRLPRILGRLSAIVTLLCSGAVTGVLVGAPWFYDYGPSLDKNAIRSPLEYPEDYNRIPAIVAIIASVLGVLVIAARLRTPRRRPRGRPLRFLSPGLSIVALGGVIFAVKSVVDPPDSGWAHGTALALSIVAVVAATVASVFRLEPSKPPPVNPEGTAGWM